MADIVLHKINEVWIKVECDKSTLYDLSDRLSFYAPNYRFHPKFKMKIWDGKIKLLNIVDRKMYLGLHKKLVDIATSLDYTVEYAPGFFNDSDISYDKREIENCSYEPRDYQEDAIKFALEKKRCVLLSPTGSGKSYIIYLILKHIKKRTLVIVPTINLVHQLSNDFIKYDKKSANWIHKIMAGSDKNTKKPIVISTWQSLLEQDEDWFSQFDVVIGDECHLFTAKSLSAIMEKCVDIEWRIGTTGTISNADAKVNALSLEGMFGEILKVSTSKELIDKKHLSNFKIDAIILKYDNNIAKNVRGKNYHDEMEFIVTNEKRNKFIANLAISQNKNTLVLFQFVEKHGKPLYELIKEKAGTDKKVFFISGEVKGDDRENIRNLVNSTEDNIIVASYGTTSTGIDIPNLHSIIFGSSYKSSIKNLQSIGRVLRNHEGKDIATLYDIVDDFSTKSKKNFSVQHFLERLKIYNEAKFDFKIHNVPF